MRKILMVVVAASVLVGGAYAVRGSVCRGKTATANAGTTGATESCASTHRAAAATSCDPSECRLPSKSAALASKQSGPRGSVRGAYDPAMAMCRFSCAAKVPYRDADLHVQPGVQDGQLVRCPVSGVVFKADAHRPRVKLATGEYVTCCDHCAAKLKRDPGRFVNL